MPTLLAGVRDPQQVDAMLPGIGKRLQTFGMSVTLEVVDGRDTYLVQIPPDMATMLGMPTPSLAITRTDTLLAIGPAARVKAALAQTKTGLSAPMAAAVNAAAPIRMVGVLTDYQASEAPGFVLAWLFSRARPTDSVIVGEMDVDARGLRLAGDAMVVAAGGMLAAIAVPAFMKYTHRSKTLEATESIRSLQAASLRYADAASHRRSRKRFPANAPRTPPTPACKDGKRLRHLPNAKTWSHPTWRALNFSVREPFLYQYEYVSNATAFTARAIGDLDCDGVSSTFEITGTLGADGKPVGAEGIIQAEPLE